MKPVAKLCYLRSCKDLLQDLETEENSAIRFSILTQLAARAGQLEEAYNFIYNQSYGKTSEITIGQDDLGDSWV